MDFRHAEHYMMEHKALDAQIATALPEAGESQLTPRERFEAIGGEIYEMPDAIDTGQQRFVNVGFGDDAPRLTLHAEYSDIEDISSLISVMAKWTYIDPRAPIGHHIKLLGLPEKLTVEDFGEPSAETLRVLGLIEESVEAATDELTMKRQESAA